jgi:hypothetical protein
VRTARPRMRSAGPRGLPVLWRHVRSRAREARGRIDCIMSDIQEGVKIPYVGTSPSSDFPSRAKARRHIQRERRSSRRSRPCRTARPACLPRSPRVASSQRGCRSEAAGRGPVPRQAPPGGRVGGHRTWSRSRSLDGESNVRHNRCGEPHRVLAGGFRSLGLPVRVSYASARGSLCIQDWSRGDECSCH